MADKSPKAAAAVEKLFKKKPEATTDEFLEVAVAADSSLKGIGKRSFNASYLLPLKRAANKGKPRRRKKATRANKKATRAKSTRAKRGGRKKASARGATGRARARELILDRDRQVIETLGGGGDPQAAYELGARLDAYIDELAAALGKG